MPENYYDKAGRYAVKLDPAGFVSWLLGVPEAQFAFRGWLDTRGVPFPGDADRTNDTVAHLDNTTAHGVPWALAIEFQTQPDADMFGRLLGYLSGLWLSLRPDAERGSRFHVGAAVVNLTGSGTASRAFAWSGTALRTELGVAERNLASEPAAELLAAIEAGTRSRCLLPWVPLMLGGGDEVLIDRWKAQAEADPNPRRRSEFAALARVFAGKAGHRDVWALKLEGWNVEVPEFVQEMFDKGEARGTCRAILELGAERFGPAPAGTEVAVRAITDHDRLRRMLKRVLSATGWPELLTTV